MKATPEDITAAYRADGTWADTTLDDLFRQNAKLHPGRLALADAPDRSTWTGGSPRSLTYEQADREIDRLAGFYTAVGLAADHVLGLHVPNTTDAVIALLAAARANIVVSPLPLHWRNKDVLTALNDIGAKGFIAADRVETRNTANAARDVAAELFSLRFVFGLGTDIPDGLIDLEPMLAEMGEDLPVPEQSRPDAADHTATISWTRSGSEHCPVTRSHNQWLSTGRLPCAEADLKDGARLVVPYALSGLTGMGAGLIPWLLCAGSLHLHHPTALNRLAEHANQVEADYVVAPGPLGPLLDRRITCRHTTLVAAWNIASPEPSPFKANHTFIDLHVADEFALVAKQRGDDPMPRSLDLGKYPGPRDEADTAALIEIAATQPGPAGEKLLLAGPSVANVGYRGHDAANEFPTAEDGYLTTGIALRQSSNGITGFGAPGSCPPGGGNIEAVDAIYQGFPGVREAAAFLAEDPVLGARLYAALVPSNGQAPDAKAFFSYLDAEGVDLSRLPHRVFILQALPRISDGSVDRDRLKMRIQRPTAAVA